MSKKIQPYFFLAATLAVLFFGLYKVISGKPDYSLIAVALLLLGFYWQQKGLARFREIVDENADNNKQKR